MSGRHGTPFAGWTRQLGWYFGGLLATYAVGLAVFWPGSGDYPSNALFAVLMFAPTVGAILAVVLGKGHIQFAVSPARRGTTSSGTFSPLAC